MNLRRSHLFPLCFALCAFQLFLFTPVSAQPAETPFIKLVNPTKEKNTVTSSRQFIVGSTCKTCNLSINEQPVKVYNTGGFAYELQLKDSEQQITIVAQLAGKKITKLLNYTVKRPVAAKETEGFSIESLQTFPQGNLVLMAGDEIMFKVKAMPGQRVAIQNRTTLYEQPAAVAGMRGIYQGSYTVQPADSFMAEHFLVTLTDSIGTVKQSQTSNYFSVMSPLASDVAHTTGRLAHLEYGLGDDRLGGAKIGYLDSLVQLRIIGKVGSDYKVQLAKGRIAYIPDDLVTLAPKGSFLPASLTASWTVNGDAGFDYVKIPLSVRLPYQSFQLVDPSYIIVDIFGATNNTNWISQFATAKEIQDVDYEQVADDIYRIKIRLKHKQHWGHQLYYSGHTLVIKIRRQPPLLSLDTLTIALDAGHGGSNTGAGGPTGSIEKNLALAVTLKLQKMLEAAGAKVIMTRTKEQYFDNKERILFYRDSLPDILVSVHLNSSADPVNVGGTSTHYRYLGNQKLALLVNERMQELGLKGMGVIGSFNFMLNSPTEYPNVLVESLFVSNPAEEALIMDEKFQQLMAEKIMAGLQDFLKNAAK